MLADWLHLAITVFNVGVYLYIRRMVKRASTHGTQLIEAKAYAARNGARRTVYDN